MKWAQTRSWLQEKRQNQKFSAKSKVEPKQREAKLKAGLKAQVMQKSKAKPQEKENQRVWLTSQFVVSFALPKHSFIPTQLQFFIDISGLLLPDPFLLLLLSLQIVLELRPPRFLVLPFAIFFLCLLPRFPFFFFLLLSFLFSLFSFLSVSLFSFLSFVTLRHLFKEIMIISSWENAQNGSLSGLPSQLVKRNLFSI